MDVPITTTGTPATATYHRGSGIGRCCYCCLVLFLCREELLLTKFTASVLHTRLCAGVRVLQQINAPLLAVAVATEGPTGQVDEWTPAAQSNVRAGETSAAKETSSRNHVINDVCTTVTLTLMWSDRCDVLK
jgi:hypothetical protein